LSLETNILLLLCTSQCGSSSSARKAKDDKLRKQKGLPIYPNDWNRKMPYDFTGCLGHLDVTFALESFTVLRITGIIDHNTSCEEQEMQCIPPIPLHPHVWEIAIQQINDGATYVSSLYY